MVTEIGDFRTGGIEVGCDRLSTLNCGFWHRDEDRSSNQPHFDILSGLHGLKRNMDITWDYRYIAGHQEDVKGAELDRWAILNIECDVRAKGYWAELQSKVSRGKGGFSKGIWPVRLYGQPVGTNLQKYLRKDIQGGGILSFWVDSQQRISDRAVGMVDWEDQGRALPSSRITRQQWVCFGMVWHR